jgi:hypothetical protein
VICKLCLRCGKRCKRPLKAVPGMPSPKALQSRKACPCHNFFRKSRDPIRGVLYSYRFWNRLGDSYLWFLLRPYISERDSNCIYKKNISYVLYTTVLGACCEFTSILTCSRWAWFPRYNDNVRFIDSYRASGWIFRRDEPIITMLTVSISICQEIPKGEFQMPRNVNTIWKCFDNECYAPSNSTMFV